MNLLDISHLQSPDATLFYRDYVRSTSSSAFLPGQDAANPLRASADQLCELLLESAVDGVYGLDLQGYVVFVNPAARRLTGWTLEDLRGRTQHSMVHHSHADGSQYLREDCPIYAAFRDGEVHRRDDEVFWRKDGTSFPVAYSSAPLFKDGKPSGAVVVFRDRTNEVLRQEWDAARIGCLTALLHGEPAAGVLRTLCKAFRDFQPGFALQLARDGGAPIASATQGSPMQLLQELTVQPANGAVSTHLQILCTHMMAQSETLAAAVRDAVNVIELAG